MARSGFRMSRACTADDLSREFDEELIWRRREISDLKNAVKIADAVARVPLLKALLTISYAHWEGYVKECASKYFAYITRRRSFFSDLDDQFYCNSFLSRLDGLYQTRLSIEQRCSLIRDIISDQNKRFAYVNKDLVDTRSNLNSDVVKDICFICGVDPSFFEGKRIFIDTILLKRRNAIAHGQREALALEEMDSVVAEVMSLMDHFRTLLENKIYTNEFRRS